jgi:hypothetical protein
MQTSEIDIDKLEAGPQLDALVAEEVFGRSVTRLYSYDKDAVVDAYFIDDPSKSGYGESVPHYSMDIAAAWLVVAKLSAEGRGIQVFINSVQGEEGVYIFDKPRAAVSIGAGYAPTVQLAICKAALKAVLGSQDVKKDVKPAG